MTHGTSADELLKPPVGPAIGPPPPPRPQALPARAQPPGRTSAAEAPTSAARSVDDGSRVYWSLNSVRALLGLLVMMSHLSGTIALDKYFGFGAFAEALGFGGARVPFFFVLSGFVLTLVYARDFGVSSKAPAYLWRRFMRIYPTYWIILLLVLIPTLALPQFREAIPHEAWAIAKMFLLLPQAPGVGGATGAPVLIVAWTLHYEIVFCLLFGLWIWNRTLGMLAALALVANAMSCWDGSCGNYRNFLADSSMLHFAFGVAAATVARKLPPMRSAMTVAWVAGAVYLIIALTAGDDMKELTLKLVFGALASLILCSLISAESSRPPERSSKLVKLLSDSSYVLYLLHFPLISLLCKLLAGTGLRGVGVAVVAFIAIALACVGAAVLFHLHIEKRVHALR